MELLHDIVYIFFVAPLTPVNIDGSELCQQNEKNCCSTVAVCMSVIVGDSCTLTTKQQKYIYIYTHTYVCVCVCVCVCFGKFCCRRCFCYIARYYWAVGATIRATVCNKTTEKTPFLYKFI